METNDPKYFLWQSICQLVKLLSFFLLSSYIKITSHTSDSKIVRESSLLNCHKGRSCIDYRRHWFFCWSWFYTAGVASASISSSLSNIIRPCVMTSDWGVPCHCPWLIMSSRHGPIIYLQNKLIWMEWRSQHRSRSQWDRSEIDLISLREGVHTWNGLVWIDLSSHSSVHTQIVFQLDRSEIDLTSQCEWAHSSLGLL